MDDFYQVVNGKTVKYLFAGTIRIAEIRNGAIHYYHKDHLGSSSVLTDANGSRIESAEYLPFGGIREYAGTWTSDYKFTDQEMDTESGLYNFNARLYDPTLGRFISPDPAVPDLSNPASPRVFDPQMLNRYSYCRNNPMIYVDPSGLEDEEGLACGDGPMTSEEEDHSEDRSGNGDNDTSKDASSVLFGGWPEEIDPGTKSKLRDLLGNLWDGPSDGMLEIRDDGTIMHRGRKAGPDVTIGKISAISGLTLGVAAMLYGIAAKNAYIIKGGFEIAAFGGTLALIEFGFKGDTSKVPMGGIADYGVAFDICKGIGDQINAP